MRTPQLTKAERKLAKQETESDDWLIGGMTDMSVLAKSDDPAVSPDVRKRAHDAGRALQHEYLMKHSAGYRNEVVRREAEASLPAA